MSPAIRNILIDAIVGLLLLGGVVFFSPRAIAVEMSKENFFQLATLAARDGEYGHAVDFFKKAIELDPKFVPAYNSLGVIYETSSFSNLNEAIRYFKLATDIDPHIVESWNNLGRAYYTQGDFMSSEKALLHSLAINADQPDVEITLGWVYLLGQSRGEEAVDHFEKGIGKVDNTMVYYGMGLANMIQGDRFKVLDSITALRKRKREDLAVKLEEMLKKKVKLTSGPGTPLITGAGDERSVLTDQLKAMGKNDGSTEGIQVRLRGPLQ
jgi:tetratricopeptide (TPR) repeat protein